MSHKIVLITLVSVCMTTNTTAAPNVVELALRSIGSGSLAEMKRRIFSLPISACEAEDTLRIISSQTRMQRESRITEGPLLRRVARIIKPIIALHNRSERVELFLYHDDFPGASVWMGCVLAISDALAKCLRDDELAGIVAHEMAHAYFMNEFRKARNNHDQLAMRIVELKCDAVAMLTLKLLGHDPADHLRALRRLTDITRLNGYTSLDTRSHPSIEERSQFAQRFIKLLATDAIDRERRVA